MPGSTDGKQQTPSEKMEMPRDGARVHRCSKKASPQRRTIKCVRHPGRRRIAANQNHNSRTPFACHVRSAPFPPARSRSQAIPTVGLMLGHSPERNPFVFDREDL